MKKRSFFSVSRLLTLAFLVVAVGCSEDQKSSVEKPVLVQDSPAQEGWNSKIVVTKAGKRQAVVAYGHMRRFENRPIVYFDQGVDVDFYDSEGKHTTWLSAMEGEYHEKTEDVKGVGNVRVVSDSGITLKTQQLRWINGPGRIVSESAVMITTAEGDTLYGSGFESNADLTHWVLSNPWGRTEKRIDIEQFEASFRKKGASP